MRLVRLGLTIVLATLLSATARAYSVLGHEATVDAAWADSIRPLLRKRFPRATDADLQKARAYAYGGSVINRAVPLMFPKLRDKYGDWVTYVQSPGSHVRTEFSFDVVQVATGKYRSEAYHDFIGFEVPKEVLERAFRRVYGLEMKDIFADDRTSRRTAAPSANCFRRSRASRGGISATRLRACNQMSRSRTLCSA